MKDRIKQVRSEAKLNQTKFGERLGVSRSAVQKWEMGINVPDSPSIKQICQKFGINETWLRTGYGEPRVSQYREQEMAALFKELMADRPESFRRALVSALLRFNPNGPEWEILEKIYDSVAKELSPPEDPEK